ncbi:hypothetical protein PRIC2_010941 [Phytophthora ramorum]
MSATPTIKPKKNMTDDERAQVVTAVLALSSNGFPKKGAFIEVATKFPFTVITVRRVWHRADENTKANGTSTSTSRMKGRCGRHETDRSAALERLRAVPPHPAIHDSVRSRSVWFAPHLPLPPLASRAPPSGSQRRQDSAHGRQQDHATPLLPRPRRQNFSSL